ncbi:Uncharacterized protein ToN1_19270 [Aromatoleum petrolei]|nr:Uncharacterized protein ToN1_19270 [Aromatoleum petrolei]
MWGNNDLVDGVVFFATLQLRTPLRVLSRHKEVYSGSGVPPTIATEAWHGVWLPRLRAEPNASHDEDSTVASDVGPVPDGGREYLRFLVAVRGIVEQNVPVKDRMAQLKTELANESWSKFVRKLGGKQAVVERFFPRFVNTLPGLSEVTKAELWKLRLRTPSVIETSPDATLLAVRGLGPAKLRRIRELSVPVPNTECEYADLVER